jgi:transposase-like protein
MTPADAAKRERAFVLYHVQGKTVADVARELNTSPASVIRWARGFETREPARAAQLRSGDAPAAAPAGFMARLRAAQAPAEPAAPAAPPAPAEAPPAEPPEPDDDLSNESLLDFVKTQIREARAMARSSDKREHVMRTIAGMLPVLDRIEKRMRDDGVIHLTAADLERGKAQLAELRDAVCAAPRVCAECGKRMRMRESGA